MSLPHGLTFLRICLSPLFPLIYLGYAWLGLPFSFVPWILFGLLAISELSDLLDGSIARRRNQVTDLGKVLDPMADSVVHLSLFLALTQGIIQISVVWFLLFLYRELLVGTLRTLLALRGVALAARFSGKLKTLIQAVASFAVLLAMGFYTLGWLSLETLRQISQWSVAFAAFAAWVSGIDYLRVVALNWKLSVKP